MTSHKIPEQDLALPLGSLVLVTGATGFIAGHIVAAALSFGYKVRGTVRSAEKAAKSKEVHGNNSNYSTIIVPDVTAPSAFDEAIQGVHGVFHVATDLSFDNDPAKVVNNVKSATLSIMEASAATPSVKRVVWTSSSAAATLPKPNTKFHLNQESWNDEAVSIAWNTPVEHRGEGFEFRFVVYAASKTEGERAAWSFVRDKKPGFTLNTVLPNFNSGRILPGTSPGPSSGLVVEAFHGRPNVLLPPQYMIDVEDDAKIHVACLADREVNSQRVYGFAYPFNWNDVLAAMRKLRPEANIIDDIPDLGIDLSTVENEKGADLLRKWWGQDGYRTLEESVALNIEDLK